MRDYTIEPGPVARELPEVFKQLRLPAHTDEGFAYLGWTEYDPSTHLIEHAQAADPAVTFVDMNEAKTITVGPQEDHDLFTIGLGGCDAVLLLSHSNTRSVATLVHYDGLDTRLIPMLLAATAKSKHLGFSEDVRHSILILTLGEPSKSGEPYLLEPCNGKLKALVQDAVQEVVGSDIAVRVVPYSMDRAGRSSSLIISWRGGESQRISYNFGQQEFGDLPLPDA